MVWVLPGPVPGVSLPRGLPALPNTLMGPGLFNGFGNPVYTSRDGPGLP